MTERRVCRPLVVGMLTALFAVCAPVSRADVLFTATDLGPASPSPDYYLGGQIPSDPNGNYLTLLSPSQQAAFQAGSFDAFAHPANTTSVSNPDWYGLANANQYLGLNWATGNNLGGLAGLAAISGSGNGDMLVVYTPGLHVISGPRDFGTESSGYVGLGDGPMSNYNFQSSVVAGINDHYVIFGE
jgi:hypothetical protein